MGHIQATYGPKARVYTSGRVELLFEKFQASGIVTTKNNKAKPTRKFWFYKLLTVSLLCGSEGETVSAQNHRQKAVGYSPRLLEETPFFAPFLNKTKNSCFPYKITNNFFIFLFFFLFFFESTSDKLLNKKKNGVDISILFQVMNF